MTEWLVRRGQRAPIGPFSTGFLQRGLAAGKLPSDVQACRVGEQVWRSLHEALAAEPEEEDDAPTGIMTTPWFEAEEPDDDEPTRLLSRPLLLNGVAALQPRHPSAAATAGAGRSNHDAPSNLRTPAAATNGSSAAHRTAAATNGSPASHRSPAPASHSAPPSPRSPSSHRAPPLPSSNGAVGHRAAAAGAASPVAASPAPPNHVSAVRRSPSRGVQALQPHYSQPAPTSARFDGALPARTEPATPAPGESQRLRDARPATPVPALGFDRGSQGPATPRWPDPIGTVPRDPSPETSTRPSAGPPPLPAAARRDSRAALYDADDDDDVSGVGSERSMPAGDDARDSTRSPSARVVTHARTEPRPATPTAPPLPQSVIVSVTHERTVQRRAVTRVSPPPDPWLRALLALIVVLAVALAAALIMLSQR